MLGSDRWLLFVVCLICVVCWLLVVVCCACVVVCWLLFGVGLLAVVRCVVLGVVCRSSRVVRCSLCV